jgi:nucleoside-diphosphate-sugar epimerase
VNLGNPQEMTILEFAREIIRQTGSRSRIVFKPLPKDDPRQRQPDIARAWRWLRWRPRVSLAAGLRPTIKYFRGRLGC